MNKPTFAGTATVLSRCLRQRCPHCGRGKIFKKWFSLNETCLECGLIYEPRSGDTWGFWIIFDRIFLLLILAFCYTRIVLGFAGPATDLILRWLFLVLILFGLVATMPHRMALCLGLDYLSRVFLNDPEDEYPPIGKRQKYEKKK